jgi:hypothetical protein
MATKISFIIDNPADPSAFEPVYKRVVQYAAQLPGLQRIESAKVWPKEDKTPTPAYRTLDLYFESYESASAAVQVPAAGGLFRELVGSGTPFTPLFSDIEAR